MPRDRFLVNKTNRHTEFQFYWYYDSTCFRRSFCPSSGVLSHTSALVQFMQFGDRVLPVSGSTWSPNCINCTNANVRLRTPDDGQKDCPKHVVVIPIKLELSVSVGFIHKECPVRFCIAFRSCEPPSYGHLLTCDAVP
jgi:hypothetical protein